MFIIVVRSIMNVVATGKRTCRTITSITGAVDDGLDEVAWLFINCLLREKRQVAWVVAEVPVSGFAA